MKTIGFPISHKENEKRRALIPEHVARMPHAGSLYFEKGYGEVLGIPDEEYLAAGSHICERAQVLDADVICDPKAGDGEYLDTLKNGQTVFGWIHATQNRDITDKLLKHQLTAYAWENMYESGRHVFWRNNELAGEAAILHAFQCDGRMPYETKVAVIGGGNTARGAIKVLHMLGADVMQYNRRMEALLREELPEYDVVVNCVLWDIQRKDHIIYTEDLKRMKRGALLIDVSCDRNGGIESSVPTTIENPTYVFHGVTHYAVDHTPALFYKTFTQNNSNVLYPFLEELITCRAGDVLQNAMIVRNGKILDPNILLYQNRT